MLYESLRACLNSGQLQGLNMLLEWPEHSKKIIEGVNTLHSELGAFTDVTLSAEGKQIKAHRVILASASTYFKVKIISF